MSSETSSLKQVIPKIAETTPVACEVCAAIKKASKCRKYSVSSTSSEENSVASHADLIRRNSDDPGLVNLVTRAGFGDWCQGRIW